MLLVSLLLLLPSLSTAFDSTEIRMLQDEYPLSMRFLPSSFSSPRRYNPRLRSVDSLIPSKGHLSIGAVISRWNNVHSTEEPSSIPAPSQDKRSAPLIRFGKRSLPMNRDIRQDALGSPLIRFGKRSNDESEEYQGEEEVEPLERYARAPASAPLIRFGKRAPEPAPLIRFGRAPGSAPLIRFGKRSSLAPLVRFGRTASAPLIRFGKRSMDD